MRDGQVIFRTNINADPPSFWGRAGVILLWIVALVGVALVGVWLKREFFTPPPRPALPIVEPR